MIDDPLIPETGILPRDDGTARWCVWAPKARTVELILGRGDPSLRVRMVAEGRGFFAGSTPMPKPGDRYAYSLDGGAPLPDPRSRWQPEGIDAPSAVLFPSRFAWDEGPWTGIAREDLTFYELHIGTFTPEGTFDAAIHRLDALKELGITAIELMPVAQFPGAWGWGYDGVFPFAVQDTYGGPEGLRRLVEACHRRGLAIVLDVIYNHFGPDGNVFPRFGSYLNERYRTDWGPAINYDGNQCDAVRAMVLDNVRMWVRDYRFDGLRIDAADQIFDRGPRHILAEMASVAHAEADRRGRPCHIFAEADMNDAGRFLHPTERCGFGLDALWNDDFHHAAHVVLTGDATGYFQDFADGPKALAKVVERIYVNDGSYSPFRDRRHGAPADGFPGSRFLAFVQNHDQIANGNAGKRHGEVLSPPALRLAAGLLLLSPRLPMLFQGEEYGETNPWPFFCDFQSPDLIEKVRAGRKAEFAYFGREAEPPDPVAKSTRDAAVLSWSWDDPTRAGLRRLYRDLFRLRRDTPALRDFRPARTRLLDGEAVLDVLRGGDGLAPSLRILFNLTGQDRALPTDLATEQPSFRSEVPAYGADEPEADRRFTHLRPHEFQLFGASE